MNSTFEARVNSILQADSTFFACIRYLVGVLRVSFLHTEGRTRYGLLELLPQVTFYSVHGLALWGAFRSIDGATVPGSVLLQFFLILCFVDSAGDALLFKGLAEHVRALKRGFPIFYLLAPGTPLVKAFFLRFDVPMLAFASLFGLAALVHGAFVFDHSFLEMCITLLLLLLGVLTHVILTGAFHVIQAYFDRNMPIAFGSPAARLYTKPIHLTVTSLTQGIAVIALYPVYFASALPAAWSSNSFPEVWEGETLHLLLAAGACSLVLWIWALNTIAKRSYQKWM